MLYINRMLARMKSAFVDRISFNHSIVRSSESYSENSGFINRCNKLINLWKSGASEHPQWPGIVSSCPVLGAEVIYSSQQCCTRYIEGIDRVMAV